MLRRLIATGAIGALMLTLAASGPGCSSDEKTGSPDNGTPPGTDGSLPPAGDMGWAEADASGEMPLTISASSTALAWNEQCHASPAVSTELEAGTYMLSLTSADISKGEATRDNYVLIGFPFGPGHGQGAHRFRTLNGLGDTFQFTLQRPGRVLAWFVDSDTTYNEGQATLTVSPGASTITVDAVDNVLAWRQECNSAPVTVENLPAGTYTLELQHSTLAETAGYADDYVLVRLPLEAGNPYEHMRYVSLNGVGARITFTFEKMGWDVPLRVWFPARTTRGTGSATVVLTSGGGG